MSRKGSTTGKKARDFDKRFEHRQRALDLRVLSIERLLAIRDREGADPVFIARVKEELKRRLG